MVTESTHKRLIHFMKGPGPFIIPALIILIIMRAFPFFWQFWLSMTNMRLGSVGEFIALKNYAFIFNNPSFYQSIGYTVVFLLSTVGGQMLIGLALALLLERDFKGKNIYRIFFLIPWIVSGLVVGILWQLMLVETPYGLLNAFIIRLGGSLVPWLSNADIARVAVILVYIWKGLGFSMILLSSGLKTVPLELIESADIDGASYMQKLLRVKIPMMKDIISVNLIFAVIASLNSYETVYVLTSGGPGGATSLIALLMFQTAFGDRSQLGRGAAIGVIMFLINLLLVLIYVRKVKFGRGARA
jgi:multiple sugar transport system permease protein